MVLGEAQILHQLKTAYGLAEEAGTTGIVLNKLLRRSFEVGKRVRTETRIGENSLSIASVSVDLARNVFGELGRRVVLVVGAGEMAELVVTHLQGHGVNRIMVANRTFERGLELAQRFGGEAVPYEDLEGHLAVADIVITSTASHEPIITKADMDRVMRRRKNRPVFLIDIALPRDVDPAVNKVYNAYLYDIDDLQDVVASNMGERQREAVLAQGDRGRGGGPLRGVDGYAVGRPHLGRIPRVGHPRQGRGAGEVPGQDALPDRRRTQEGGGARPLPREQVPAPANGEDEGAGDRRGRVALCRVLAAALRTQRLGRRRKQRGRGRRFRARPRRRPHVATSRRSLP